MSQRRLSRKSCNGFSLVELMVSVTILAVGFAALLALMMTAMMSNNTNRRDTSATTAAQTIMETIAAPSAAVNSNITTVTDCAGNTLTINTAVGGAPLDSSGAVDFTQATVSGYYANYVACAPSGEGQTTYDVRWNIQTATQVQVS